MMDVSAFQSKFDKNDLNILKKYVSGKKFLIETGSGISTHYIADGLDSDAHFYTIDVFPTKEELRTNGAVYLEGWSIAYEDFIKPNDRNFVESRYKIVDHRIVFSEEREARSIMGSKTDLVRKIIRDNSDKRLDFYFSDCGEYCGLPEWRIVKDIIDIGGIFAAHDIYHPKSIKNFKVVEEIENSKDWAVLEKTKTKQGMFIAMKVPKGFQLMDNSNVSIAMFGGIRKDSLRREPATVEWVKGMKNGVLFDVGANVGAYSLIASRHNPNLKVYAFEPMHKNYYALIENIIVNSLSEKIVALNCAISSDDGFQNFNCSSLKIGSALSALGEPIDYKGDLFCPEFIQHIYAFSIDNLVFKHGLPAPDYVKIDVDSIEYEIVIGMQTCLSECIRSVLIEGDKRQYEKFDSLIRSKGFSLISVEEHAVTNNYIYDKI